MSGRCWPANGAGGTLNAKGTGPGPYYVLAADGVPLVGSHGTADPDPLYRAVAYGVTAIQRALNRRLPRYQIRVDGVFGPETSQSTIRFQRKAGIADDGAIGPQTSRELFYPDMLNRGTEDCPPCLILGLMETESSMDPGAIGYSDDEDRGLGQKHGGPEDEAFAPILAINYVVEHFGEALVTFDGDKDLAIASYNLGAGGARLWDSKGRPDPYTPPGSTTPRTVVGYIAKVQSHCVTEVQVRDGAIPVTSWC